MLCLRNNILIFIFFCLSVSCSVNEVETVVYPVFDVEFKSGDIAFRRGGGIASNVVLMSDKKGEFSHVGIVVVNEDSVFVIHAVPGEAEPNMPDVIKKETIEEYYSSSKSVLGKV